jgi:hypothetical protein
MYHACINEWRKKIFLYYFMTLSLIIEWHTHMLMYNACSGIYLFFGHIAHRDESLIAWFFECVCVCGYDILSISVIYLYYCFLPASESLSRFVIFFPDYKFTHEMNKWQNCHPMYYNFNIMALGFSLENTYMCYYFAFAFALKLSYLIATPW